MQNNNRVFGLSLFQLKIIAMTTMVTDHIGEAFFPHAQWIRLIGRIAFPVYAFLIANGFFHTHNRAKYLARLIIFALISQVPFILVGNANKGIEGLLSDPFMIFSALNSLFVLSLALISIWIIDVLRKRFGIGGHISGIVIAGGITMLSVFIKCDYCYFGIPLAVACYEAMLFKNSREGGDRAEAAVLQFALGAAAVVFYVIMRNAVSGHLVIQFVFEGMVQVGAVGMLCFYNGQKGLQNTAMKYIFYCFYPVHLAVIYLIYMFIH